MAKKAVKKTGGVAEKKTLTSKPVSQDNESRLLELVELIYDAEITLATARNNYVTDKDRIKKFESDADAEAANDKGLKNETQRKAFVSKLLEENEEYKKLHDSFQHTALQIAKQEAMVNRLVNEFSCRKLILRKEGKE